MFCKNCGKEIPDTAAHCPNCGAANEAAKAAEQSVKPAQNAAPNPSATVAAATASIDNVADKAFSIGGDKFKFPMIKIIPLLMVFYVLMGVIGTYHTNFMKIKYGKDGDWSRTCFSQVVDDSNDDKVKDNYADNGFTSFVKFIEVVVTIGGIAGIAGFALMYISKKYHLSVLSLGASAIFLLLGRLFLFIEALYLKGNIKDEYKGDLKIKGGPTWSLIFWILFLVIFIAGSYITASSIKDKSEEK